MRAFCNVSLDVARRRSDNRTPVMKDSGDAIDEMHIIRAQPPLTRFRAYVAVSLSQHIFKALAQFPLVLIITVGIRYALAALLRLPRQHLLTYLPDI